MRKYLFSLAAPLSVLSSAPALGAEVIVTYTGEVVSGLDRTNFFGAGTDLAGLDFTAVFTFDPSLGDQTEYVGTKSLDLHGTQVDARITINGVPFVFVPKGDFSYFGATQYYGRIDHNGQPMHGLGFQYGETVSDYYGAYFTLQSLSSESFIPGIEFLPSMSIGELNTQGYAGFNAYYATDQDWDRLSNYYTVIHYDVTANFAPKTLTIVSPTSAVPEPETWAMMLLGFFIVGGAIRRSRSRQNVQVSYA